MSTHLSLESIENIERELEIYVCIKDINDLRRATEVEEQEQYGIVPVIGEGHRGSVRIRKTVSNDGTVSYEHTGKVKRGEGTNREENEPSTEAMFEVYKELANDGMLKDRYIFPIEGTDLKWEVDMFPQADGNYAPWAKIDLEIPEGVQLQKVPALPIGATEVIVKNSKDPEVTKRIAELYDQYFRYKPNGEK